MAGALGKLVNLTSLNLAGTYVECSSLCVYGVWGVVRLWLSEFC